MRTTEEQSFETSRGRLTFHVTQLGGIAASKVLVKLLPLVPRLVNALQGIALKDLANAEALKKMDLSKVDFAAVAQTLASVTPEDFEQISGALLMGCFAVGEDAQSGEPVKIDLNVRTLDPLFAGCVWELFKLVGFALKVNFMGFSSARTASKSASGEMQASP